MSLSTTEMSPADIRAVCNDDNGFGGGAWWIVILFLFVMMGGGFWGNRTPNGEPVTEAGLCNAMNFNDMQNSIGRLSDNESLRMMQLSQGLASVGYENLRNFADTQQTIQNGQWSLSKQLSDCCCQNRYDALQNTNATQRMIDQVNYNMATDTCAINANVSNNARDVIDNANSNTRAVLDALNQQRLEAKQEKINDLERQVSALALAQSQTVQNQYLVNQLRPAPVPAFNVPQPYNGTTFA